MTIRMVSLRTAIGMVAGAGVLFFAGVYAARATPGGQTRDRLSFAGTLRDSSGKALSSPQMLTFVFKHVTPSGMTTICTVQATIGSIDTTGSFQTELDISACPANTFDGTDVTVDVNVGDAGVATTQPVNPVPYAKYADKVGSPDCPVGYARDMSDTVHIICKSVNPDGTVGTDEIVKVGVKASAFWIDRYEASLFDAATNAQVPNGTATFATFKQNGQWLGQTSPFYAESRKGVTPTVDITWFQANEACRARGKRLPTGDEWLAAARGTPDPAMPNDGSVNGECVTGNGASGPRHTGLAQVVSQTACISAWGVEDMIGNVAEWTNEWHAGVGVVGGQFEKQSKWPSTAGNPYDGDATWNIDGTVFPGIGAGAPYLPAAAYQGGSWTDDTAAGIYALSLEFAPSCWGNAVGFRCVLPR